MTVPDPRKPRIFTIPNALSVLRLCVLPFFVVASMNHRYTLAFALFVGAGLTDIVDGFIARRFNQRSWIGAVLDPTADKLMIFAGYVIFTFNDAIPWRMPIWLTMLIFVRDALIALFAYLLYTRIRIKRFPPSIAGKIATLLQVVGLSATIGSNSLVVRPIALPILQPVFVLMLCATLFSGVDYLRRANRMFEDGVREAEASGIG